MFPPRHVSHPPPFVTSEHKGPTPVIKHSYTAHVADHQPPICVGEDKGWQTHMGYGDFYVQQSSGTERWCYPCAIRISGPEEKPWLKISLHRAMARGMTSARLLQRRSAIMQRQSEDRSKIIMGVDKTVFLRRLTYRTTQAWEDRLEELCGERGVYYDKDYTIEVSAANRAQMGGNCLCGCGETVKVGRRFRQGHDARYHSWVMKLRDGRLNPANIPETAKVAMSEEYQDLRVLFEADVESVQTDV